MHRIHRISIVSPARVSHAPAEGVLEADCQPDSEDYRRRGGSVAESFYSRIGTRPNELRDVDAGAESLAAFGVSVPKSYQWYLALGRFRNALVLEEAARHPTPGLASLIASYRLEGYKPVEISAAQRAGNE